MRPHWIRNTVLPFPAGGTLHTWPIMIVTCVSEYFSSIFLIVFPFGLLYISYLGSFWFSQQSSQNNLFFIQHLPTLTFMFSNPCSKIFLKWFILWTETPKRRENILKQIYKQQKAHALHWETNYLNVKVNDGVGNFIWLKLSWQHLTKPFPWVNIS